MGELACLGVAVAILLAGSMASRHVTFTEDDDRGAMTAGRALTEGDDIADLGDAAGD